MAKVDVRLEFKSDGFQQVLNSPGTKALVRSTADGVASRVGWGVRVREFAATAFGHGTRPAASVWTKGKTEKQARHLEKRLRGAL